MTSYGAEITLPVFEADGVTVAVLLCECGDRQHLGLLLTRDTSGVPARPRYYSARLIVNSAHDQSQFLARTAALGDDLDNLRFNGKRIKAEWRTIHIVPSPPATASTSTTIARLTVNCRSEPPFRLPHWLISRLLAQQFNLHEMANVHNHMVIRFSHQSAIEQFLLELGLCQHHADNCHWAKVTISSHTDLNVQLRPHSCDEHHLDSWHEQSKDFGSDARRKVRLSFTKCRRSPDRTRVIHIELLGRIYRNLLGEVGVQSLKAVHSRK